MKTIACLMCCAFFFLFSCSNETKTAEEQISTEPVTQPSSVTTNPIDNGVSEKSKDQPPSSNVTAAPIDYNNLADAYCNCASNTVTVNNKLKSLMEANDTEAFEAMLPAADKAFKDAMECCKSAKFEQSTATVDQQKLFKPLKKACPDLPQQLMLKMVTEIK